MKTFRKGHEKVNCINLDAKKIADRTLKSPSQPISPLTIREDEDCVFGALSFYLQNDKVTKSRLRDFNKM